jgi:hypothetical protein
MNTHSIRQSLTALIAILLPGLLTSMALAGEVKAELRTSIAHGDIDAWGRTTALTCVVTNEGDRDIMVFVGYDGKLNRLRSPVGESEIELLPRVSPAAPHPETVPPGGSRAVYTLSLHDVLLRGLSTDTSSDWKWAPTSPNLESSAPYSPIHSANLFGWQAVEAEAATLLTEVTVDGGRITSAPLSVPVRHPDAQTSEPLKLRITTPSGETLISGEDIVAYHWPSHSLRLRAGVIDRYRPGVVQRVSSAPKVDLIRGTPFDLRLGDEVIYSGTLSSYLSSFLHAGVVVFLDDQISAPLQWSEDPSGKSAAKDPRNDERLRQELLRAGVLLQ